MWLKNLLEKWSCHHEWHKEKETTLFNSKDSDVEKEIPIRRRATYICKKCGKFKQINL